MRVFQFSGKTIVDVDSQETNSADMPMGLTGLRPPGAEDFVLQWSAPAGCALKKPRRMNRRQRVAHLDPAVALVLRHPQAAGG